MSSELDDTVRQACEGGDAGAVRAALEANFPLYQRIGRPALPMSVIAAFHGHVCVLDVLREYRFDFTRPIRASYSVAHAGAYGGHLAVLEWVQRLDPDAFTKEDANGSVPHAYACQRGQVEAVLWFARHHPAGFITFNHNGNSPVHIAAYYGHPNVLQALVEQADRGDLLEFPSRSRRTPLQLALSASLPSSTDRQRGANTSAFLLVCLGAHLDRVVRNIPEGLSHLLALWLSSKPEFREQVRRCRDRTSPSVLTPQQHEHLHGTASAYSKRLDVLRLLQAVDALRSELPEPSPRVVLAALHDGLDPNAALNDDGVTAMRIAASLDYRACLKWLQDEGYDWSAAGFVALHCACEFGGAGLLDWLRSVVPAAGFSTPNSTTGDLPHHRACFAGNAEAARWLHKHYPAGFGVANAAGELPLHLSAREDRLPFLRLVVLELEHTEAIRKRSPTTRPVLHVVVASRANDDFASWLAVCHGADRGADDPAGNVLPLAGSAALRGLLTTLRQPGVASAVQALCDGSGLFGLLKPEDRRELLSPAATCQRRLDILQPVSRFCALGHAAEHNDLHTLRRVLEAAGDAPDLLKQAVKYAATAAAAAGSKEALEVLLDRMPSGSDLEAMDGRGRTLYHLAASNNRVNVLKALVQRSGSANGLEAVDAAENTPFHAASQCKGKPEALRWLLSHLSEAPRVEPRVACAVNAAGLTPALTAAGAGAVAALDMLLNDPHLGPHLNPCPMLMHTAVTKGGPDVTGYLVVCVGLDPGEPNEEEVPASELTTDKDSTELFLLCGHNAVCDVLLRLRGETVIDGLDPDEAARLMAPVSSLEDRLVILRRIAELYVPNLTLKLVMLGLPGAGKTSVVNLAHGGEKVRDPGEGGRTVGVSVSLLRKVQRGIDDITQRPLPPATLVVCDHGGHQEYLAASRHTLTHDSVCCVTVSLKELVRDEAACKVSTMRWLAALDSASQTHVGVDRAVRRLVVVMIGTHMDEVKHMHDVRRLLRVLHFWYEQHVESGRGANAAPVADTVPTAAAAAGEGASRSPPCVAVVGVDARHRKTVVYNPADHTLGPDGDMTDVLRAIVRGAAPVLRGMYGAPTNMAWVEAAEELLLNDGFVMGLFDGQWIVRWAEFVHAARTKLGLGPGIKEAEVEKFAKYCCRLGALLMVQRRTEAEHEADADHGFDEDSKLDDDDDDEGFFPGSDDDDDDWFDVSEHDGVFHRTEPDVVVDPADRPVRQRHENTLVVLQPSRLLAAMHRALTHRYIGVYEDCAGTVSDLSDVYMDAKGAMRAFRRSPRFYPELRADEKLFVRHGVVTRRFLYNVLWSDVSEGLYACTGSCSPSSTPTPSPVPTAPAVLGPLPAEGEAPLEDVGDDEGGDGGDDADPVAALKARRVCVRCGRPPPQPVVPPGIVDADKARVFKNQVCEVLLQLEDAVVVRQGRDGVGASAALASRAPHDADEMAFPFLQYLRACARATDDDAPAAPHWMWWVGGGMRPGPNVHGPVLRRQIGTLPSHFPVMVVSSVLQRMYNLGREKGKLGLVVESSHGTAFHAKAPAGERLQQHVVVRYVSKGVGGSGSRGRWRGPASPTPASRSGEGGLALARVWHWLEAAGSRGYFAVTAWHEEVTGAPSSDTPPVCCGELSSWQLLDLVLDRIRDVMCPEGLGHYRTILNEKVVLPVAPRRGLLLGNIAEVTKIPVNELFYYAGLQGHEEDGAVTYSCTQSQWVDAAHVPVGRDGRLGVHLPHCLLPSEVEIEDAVRPDMLTCGCTAGSPPAADAVKQLRSLLQQADLPPQLRAELQPLLRRLSRPGPPS